MLHLNGSYTAPMSYCCMPYRVAFRRLRASRGSRDEALLARVVELANEYGADTDDDDDEGAGETASGDDSYLAAAQRFVNGEPPDQGNLKAHAFIMDLVWQLCAANIKDGYRSFKWIEKQVKQAEAAAAGHDLGERLKVVERLSIELIDAHLQEVASALERHGVSDRVDLRQLLAGGLPASPPLPTSPFSSAGFLRPEAARRAHGAIKTNEWTELTKEVRNTLVLIERGIEA